MTCAVSLLTLLDSILKRLEEVDKERSEKLSNLALEILRSGFNEPKHKTEHVAALLTFYLHWGGSSQLKSLDMLSMQLLRFMRTNKEHAATGADDIAADDVTRDEVAGAQLQTLNTLTMPVYFKSVLTFLLVVYEKLISNQQVNLQVYTVRVGQVMHLFQALFSLVRMKRKE
jgi:hypothetical protein